MQTNNGVHETVNDVTGDVKGDMTDANMLHSVGDNNHTSYNQADYQQQQQPQNRVISTPDSQQVEGQNMRPDSSLANNVPYTGHAGDHGHHGPPSRSAGFVGHQHQSHRHGPSNYHQQQQQQQHHHQHNQQQQYPYHGNRFNSHQRGDSESNVNHVLLITVMNPHYPITCDLIHQICSNYGKVNRIVIFKKNGVQAMVEFDNIESSKRAKSMLSGCDIYSGCCTLRIEYAKPAKLNIYRNDSNSFDYTTTNLPSRGDNDAEQGSNVDEHGGAISNQHHQYSGAGSDHHHQARNLSYSGIDTYASAGHGAASNNVDHDHDALPNHHGGNQSYPRQGHHRHARSGHSSGGALFSGPGPNHGPVMMLYGLRPEKFNCDRVFNLLCMYGNISKVKFLKSKEGCAMVQMGDNAAVDRCVSELTDVALFDTELQISYSKQPFLHDVLQPFTLPDGSPSFKDFQGNKNNRFKNPEVASKNRILPPSHVLHFFNAPYGITEDELVHFFRQNTDRDPASIKIFTPKEGNTKSFSGLAIFKDSAEAAEALVICNHMNIHKAGVSHPYILRLCFSPPSQESYSGKQS